MTKLIKIPKTKNNKNNTPKLTSYKSNTVLISNFIKNQDRYNY